MMDYGPYKNLRVASDAEAAEIRARKDDYLNDRKPFLMVAEVERPTGLRMVPLGNYATKEEAERSVANRSANRAREI